MKQGIGRNRIWESITNGHEPDVVGMPNHSCRSEDIRTAPNVKIHRRLLQGSASHLPVLADLPRISNESCQASSLARTQ